MKKPVFVFSGLLLFLLLFSFIFRSYFQFKKSIFNFLGRTTFVLVDKKNNLWVFSLEGDSGSILSLPENLKVMATRGFGEYELGKVFPLGELEGKGSVLLRETLQEVLHAPVFGFFQDSSVSSFTPNLISKVVQNAIFKRSRSDLSRDDLLFLYLKTRRLDKTKVKMISLESDLGEVFKDRKIREESLAFEVLNATDHLGFAQASASLLDRCGGRIVRISDASQKQPKCEILASSSALSSYTVNWLKLIYPCEIKELINDTGRVDISLILGEEYWKKWSEKW